MTELEQRAARALASCSMLPASRDKHFTRWCAKVSANSPQRDLSSGARRVLWLLVRKYRRQIHDQELLDTALLNGEPREVVEQSKQQPSLFL